MENEAAGMLDLARLLVGIAMAYWGMRICRRKGRTEWKGALAGGFGGIIGIIVCYCLEDRSQAVTRVFD